MSTLAATVDLKNPFPGLRPFQPGEEHLFFGRENQADKMVDKLAANRFLSVVGTSGTGKSSLVNCGLLPALHRGIMTSAGSSWCVVYLRPGGDPLRSMARAFSRESRFTANIKPVSMPLVDMLDITLRMSSLGISELYEFARFSPEMNLLVFVDQFEELFRYQKTADGSESGFEVSGRAVAFVNLLLEARAQTDFPIFVSLTMRSDFLGECSQFDRLPEVINDGQYLVPRLTREERRQAIAGPIAVRGAELSPVLLTRVVNDVGDNPDQLSIMQHAMNRTWAYWRQEGGFRGPLSLEHYDNEKVGTMARALDLHANEAYSELKTPRAQRICERVFKALTDKGTDPRGIRRGLRFERLCKIVGAGEDEVLPVLDVFRDPSRAFLMPSAGEPLDPKTVVDISHEILMRVWLRLKGWADEEAKSASTYRHIAETAERHGLEQAGLWGDPDSPDLKTALEWKDNQDPNEAWSALYRPGFQAAIDFLKQSRKVRDGRVANAEFERRWRRVVRPILIAVVASVFLVFSQSFSRALAPGLASIARRFFMRSTGALQPNASMGMDISDALASIFGVQLFAVICLLSYMGLAIAAKRVYRRIASAAILEEVSAPPKLSERSLGSEDPNQPPTRTEVGTETQGVQTLVPARFWRILLAGMIDLISILFVLMLEVFAFVALAPYESGSPGDLFEMITFYASCLLLPWLYGSLMTCSRLGGTLGDLALGIRLTDMSGQKPSFKRALGRYAATFLSWLFFGFGFVLQLVRPARRSLHDHIAGTIVVRRRKSKPVPELAVMAE